MPPKRSATSPVSGSEPKRKRKMLTIKEKIELLDMLNQGRSYAEVGRHYGINESTVRYIKKEEKNIRSTATVTLKQTAKRVLTARNKFIIKMEAALALWIYDCRKNNISLNTNTIRTKAKQLYDRLAEKMDDQDGGEQKEDCDHEVARPSTSTGSSTKSKKFTASKGWFDKFQKRYGLKGVCLHGEAASTNKSEAEDYVEKSFKDITKDGSYLPEQVFNTDDTGLFWMLSRTFIMKEEPLDENMEKMTKSASEEEEEEQRTEEEELVGLTLERLETLHRKALEIQQLAEDWDMNKVRSLQFRNSIDSCMSAYKTLLTQEKKQRQQLSITTSPITRTKKSVSPTPSMSHADDTRDTAPSVEVVVQNKR